MSKAMLADLCYAETRDRKVEVAVIPVGATEVHGLHLPFGNDTYQVEEVARLSAERALEQDAQVLVLPSLPYGIDANLLEFPYTLHIAPTTMMQVLGDLIKSMRHHGVRKVMLLNGHGGNCSTLETLIRELQGQVDTFVAMVNFWMVAADVADEVRETTQIEHACEIETSYALALYPEKVRMDLAEPTTTNESRLPLLQKYGGKFSRPWHLYTNNGGVGDPTKASKEKGKRIIQVTVERLAEAMVELSQAEMNDRFPY